MKRFFNSLIYGHWLLHKKPNEIMSRVVNRFMSWLLGLFGRTIKPETYEIQKQIPIIFDVYLYSWLFGAIAMMISISVSAVIQDVTGYSSVVTLFGSWPIVYGLYWYYTRDTTYESLMEEFEGESKAMKRWYMIQEVLVWVIPTVIMIVHLKFFVEYPA